MGGRELRAAEGLSETGKGTVCVTTTEPTAEGERALNKGFYVVKEGDTLAGSPKSPGSVSTPRSTRRWTRRPSPQGGA